MDKDSTKYRLSPFIDYVVFFVYAFYLPYYLYNSVKPWNYDEFHERNNLILENLI